MNDSATKPCAVCDQPTSSGTGVCQRTAECKHEYRRRWAEANSEKLREHRRQYYQANREALDERSRNWAKANPEATREIKRRWNEANREEKREAASRYRDANRDELREKGNRYYAASREACIERTNRWLEANREKMNTHQRGEEGRARMLWHKHGMLPENWVTLWDAQLGRCYLCGDHLDGRRAAIEHDHSCCPSQYSCWICRRGLACQKCNAAVGLAGDNPVRLRRIADALEVAQIEVIKRKDEPGIEPGRAGNAPKSSESIRVQKLYYRHGMQLGDWTALWDAQLGRCYLCGDPLVDDATAIDHDHNCCPSGKSCRTCRRGLACSNCNSVIGLAKDSPACIRRMADALEAAQLKVTQRKDAPSPAVDIAVVGTLLIICQYIFSLVAAPCLLRATPAFNLNVPLQPAQHELIESTAPARTDLKTDMHRAARRDQGLIPREVTSRGWRVRHDRPSPGRRGKARFTGSGATAVPTARPPVRPVPQALNETLALVRPHQLRLSVPQENRTEQRELPT